MCVGKVPDVYYFRFSFLIHPILGNFRRQPTEFLYSLYVNFNKAVKTVRHRQNFKENLIPYGMGFLFFHKKENEEALDAQKSDGTL
jgi:hypothetical protein